MTQTVILIPGLHFGTVTYFSDRFAAGLGVALNVGRTARYRVVAVPTTPTGSFATRQTALLENLSRIEDNLIVRGQPPTSRWHLVGHSTGGVDAAFLTRARALRVGKGGRSEFGPDAVPAPHGVPIASVTGIAAPYHGSTLALADVAKLAEGGIKEMAAGIVDVASGVALSASVHARTNFALGLLAGRNELNFLYHLIHPDGPASELRPDVVSKLTQAPNLPAREVPHFAIATCAPEPTPDSEPLLHRIVELAKHVAKARAPSPAHSVALFRLIWTLTRDTATPDVLPPPAFPASGTYGIIHAEGRGEVTVVDGSNDGIVNTNRQVHGKLVGLVVGDHADVLGRYRRTDMTDGKTELGLLTSGAEFGDLEFFALIRLVARGILHA